MNDTSGTTTNHALVIISSLCRNIDDYGISLINAQGNIASWNKGAENLLGFGKRAILGKPMASLFPDSNQASLALIEADLKDHKDSGEQTFKTAKRSRSLAMSLEKLRLKDFDGYLLVICARNKTLSTNKARSLASSLASLLKAQEYQAIIGVNNLGEIMLWNDLASSVFGYDSGTAFKQPLKMIFSDQCIRDLYNGKYKIIDSPVETHKRIPLKRRNGGSIEADLLKIQTNKRSPAVTILSIDIIENLTAAFNLRTDKELMDMKEILSLFTHDLKNQLLGFKQLFNYLNEEKAGHLNPKQHRVIEAIRSSNNHLLSMIEKLELIKDQRDAVVYEKLDMKELAKECVEGFQHTALLQDIHLELKPSSQSITITGDRVALKQVLNNIIHNALKYTPSGGKIEVGTRDDDGCAVAVVKDTGYGIPKDIQNEIFKKNAAFSNAHAASSNGLGIGLYLSKKIVNSHKGSISFDSQENDGTSFFVRLPK